MHDPMTVVCDIPNPFARRYSWGKSWKDRPSLVTTWHIDPEKDGTDDSCDWFNSKKKLNDKEMALRDALYDMENIVDRYPYYPDSKEYKAFDPLRKAVLALLRPPPRPWWRHPRFHFWHYKIQIHPLQNLKRWLFSRCCKCGGRFSWGYAPSSECWDGTGPLWFRNEEQVRHHDCLDPERSGAQCCMEAKS